MNQLSICVSGIVKPIKHEIFSMENHTFESDSDQEFNMPSEQTIGQYHREYSYIMKQTDKFLKDCKNSVEKFISLNQFGVGINLQRIFHTFVNIESNLVNKNGKSRNDIKEKYEISFKQLLQRMAEIIEDLLMFEIGFKQEYFGQIFSTQVSSQQSSPTKKMNFQKFNGDGFSNEKSKSNSDYRSISSPRSVSRNISCNQDEKEKVQSELREILQKKLQPIKQSFQNVVNEQFTTHENIEKISEKVDTMLSKVSSAKIKEQRIIEIFKKNRLESTCEPHSLTRNSLFDRKKEQNNRSIKNLEISTEIQNQYTLQSLKQPIANITGSSTYHTNLKN